MCVKTEYSVAALIVGIITFVMMPTLLLAQSRRTYTAPPAAIAEAKKPESPVSKTPDTKPLSEIAPQVEFYTVERGNPENLEAGFYASYRPVTYDTVYVYEGGTEEFEIIGVHPGKEIIHGDSATVITDVNFRMNHLNENDIPVPMEKKVKTNSAIIRSGFIPAQGLGSKRYRFAVKPSKFTLTESSMISASVHLTGPENIGTILCAVTSIDYKKGIFNVEASNEIPKGESINWIIVNTP
jgi:hypothetical protein